MLSAPKKEPPKVQKPPITNKDIPPENPSSGGNASGANPIPSAAETMDAAKPEFSPQKEIKEVDEKQFLQKQLSSVETFQYQQKLMEEQNKMKKQLLFSAIQQRCVQNKTWEPKMMDSGEFLFYKHH